MFAAVIASITSIIIPFIIRDILKTDLPSHNSDLIIKKLALSFFLIIITMICSYIRLYWGHVLGVRMEYDMRAEFFRHIQKLSFSYFDNVKTGHIMSRIANDLNYIAEIAHHAPEDFFISVMTILGAFTFMFIFNYRLATLALIPLPIMIFWGIKMGPKMKQKFRRVQEKIADINSTVENSVQGIREVKSYANEDIELDKFDNANSNFLTAKNKAYKTMALFYSGIQFWVSFYSWLVIAGGSWLVLRGQADVSELLIFILYVNIIMKPIERLNNFAEQLQRGAVSFDRFMEILDIEPEINDRHDAYSLKKVNGEIEIKNIKFRYTNDGPIILDGISISIKAGEYIAIVGESGAGKSTLASLIPRFYELDSGTIKIDGHDIMRLKQRFLRENIGIVQQNVFLFDGTIRENIIYGNQDATEQELIEAAKNANILEFIQSCPDGFDTLTGERGVKLSGGQKQRIAIARVFLKNPPILILDEATSSLDNESESLIQEALERLAKNRTTLVIAHRLSTIKKVDRIFVMKQGKIVEQGTHRQLIEKDGYYNSLYQKNQF